MNEPVTSHAELPASLGWSLAAVSYRYPGSEVDAVSEVTTEILPARCTALIGPNGSGKSTLSRMLIGTLKTAAGAVSLGGRDLSSWSRRELARSVGVVAQNEEINFPLTVREMVGMGRYPHLGPLRPFGERDHAAVEAALRRCDVARFADRDISAISGGERQRARVARALAQEPRALVLDEPTVALDVRHEMEIFEVVRDLAASGVTVVLVTHNLNLAARYADRLLLFDAGRLVADGPPLEVLDRARLERVYQWPVSISTFAGPGPDAGAIQVTPISARGAGRPTLMTNNNGRLREQ